MELGLQLDDDSLFETRLDKNEDETLCSYNVKNHSPLWFYDSELTSDSPDECNVVKCKGDHSYSIGNYEEALHYFIHCQGLLSTKYNVLWRDLEEAKARCFIRLHRQQEALSCALSLVKLAGNVDQATAVLILLQTIYMDMNNICEEERVLKKLLVLHPSNVDLWVRLSKLYRKPSLSSPGAVSNGCNQIKIVNKSDVESSNSRLTSDVCVGECVECSVSESQSASVDGDSCDMAASLSRLSCTDNKALEIQGTLGTSDCEKSEFSSSIVDSQLKFKSMRMELAKALICLLNARFLLKRSRNAQSLQRHLNEALQMKVHKELNCICVPQTVLQFCTSSVKSSLSQTDTEPDDASPPEVLPIGASIHIHSPQIRLVWWRS